MAGGEEGGVDGADGLERVLVGGGEIFERGRVFAGDDEGPGVNAVTRVNGYGSGLAG